MKRINIILLLAGLLAACSDWLDVRPQTEKIKEELFDTQKGFEDALVGAYIRLKGDNAYGNALSWGTIEYMAQHWDVTTANSISALSNLKRYEYANAYVEVWMSGMYQELYRVIADVNSILERIDDRRDIFDQGVREMIKGEALALRAFCHLDVLRLFGPIPGTASDEPVLPYVKTVSNVIREHSSYQQFTRALLDDLDEAESLLGEVDPIRAYSITELNSSVDNGGVISTGNDFQAYRQVRMNYLAALAIRARFHLWMQDKAEAGRYAQMVIEAADRNGNSIFRLGTQGDMTLEDFTASTEHIFALAIHDLAARAESRFGQQGSYIKQDFDYYLGQLFPAAERTVDIRFALWIPKQTDNTYKILKKFIQRDSRPILQLPLVRLSEMYLIRAECAATIEEANAAYAPFAIAKGIPFSGFSSEQDRESKIIREYNREFYAEGQGFFTYKRLNAASILWAAYPIVGSPAVYVAPLPTREIEYHNK
ncbi:MAG: RagB/SusD family nutrient uptake outer membrane protein [Odoribacteraceae bacterium]|jgi:hypothetical protein|nr:RagB/SusD family nutrient uptake outer membrane protein [Odoribacteraceae bacterium]